MNSTTLRRQAAGGVVIGLAGIVAYVLIAAMVGAATGSAALGVCGAAWLILPLAVFNGACKPGRCLQDQPHLEQRRRLTARRLVWSVAALVVTWLSAQTIFLWISLVVPPTASAVSGELPLVLLAVILVGPLAEEVLCRDLLYRHLTTLTGAPAAAIGSSVVFALLHIQPARVAATFLLGLLSVALFELWRRSLLAAWLGHALFNLAALLVPVDAIRAMLHPVPTVTLLGNLTVVAISGALLLRLDGSIRALG